jgi:histone-lysine N-methyltransferase ASH1L
MLFDQNMILDATRGSLARFVNHSCEPNAKMEKWYVSGVPRMALFAGDKGILPGEELSYDYNFDPFSIKNVQECRCGAKSCRGFLGRRQPEQKKEAPVVPAAKKKRNRKAGAKVSAGTVKKARVLTKTSGKIIKKKTASGKGSTLKKQISKTTKTTTTKQSAKKQVTKKQQGKPKIMIKKTTVKTVKTNSKTLKKTTSVKVAKVKVSTKGKGMPKTKVVMKKKVKVATSAKAGRK